MEVSVTVGATVSVAGGGDGWVVSVGSGVLVDTGKPVGVIPDVQEVSRNKNNRQTVNLSFI